MNVDDFDKLISYRTGLSVKTVKEFLKKGWTYKEQLEKDPIWVKESDIRVITSSRL